MGEKLLAQDPSIGYVTRESRTPQVELLCLLFKARLLKDCLIYSRAKRRCSEAKETAIATPAVTGELYFYSTEALQYLLTVVV